MIKCWYWGARSFTAEGSKKGNIRGACWLHHVCLVTQMCPTLCDHMDCSQSRSSVHGDSPGKNTGVGCHALLQGIFPTQGLNPGLPHCRQILYGLSWLHQFSSKTVSLATEGENKIAVIINETATQPSSPGFSRETWSTIQHGSFESGALNSVYCCN